MAKVDMNVILENTWKVFSKNLVSLVLGHIVALIVPSIVFFTVFLVSLFLMFMQPQLFILWLVISITIAIIIYPPFIYGYTYFVNTIRKNRNAKIDVIFQGVKKFFLRSIGQTVLCFLIVGAVTLLVALPFLGLLINTLEPTHPSTGSVNPVGFWSVTGLIIIEVIAILAIGFVLMYWQYAIVIEDTGVFDGLSKAYRVWRNNLGISFIVLLITALLGVLIGTLGLFGLLAALLIGPGITVLMVETYNAIRR